MMDYAWATFAGMALAIAAYAAVLIARAGRRLS